MISIKDETRSVVAVAVITMLLALFAPNSSSADESQTEADNGVIVYSSGRPPAVKEAVLFGFDDVCIPFRQNLFLQMHPGEKYSGNPVLKRGAPGTPDSYRAQINGTVIREGGTFKMWYVAADDDAVDNFSRLVSRRARAGTEGWRAAYAESKDGIHWVKPNLGLVEYHGDRNNNLVELPPGLGPWHLIVICDANDPDPTRRYKMMLSTRSEKANSSLNASSSIPLLSADGLHWRVAVPTRLIDDFVRLDDIVTTKEFFEQGGLYQWGGMYYLTGQQEYPTVWLPDGEPCGRVMSIFRSADFVHWSGTKTLGFVRYGYRSTPLSEGEESHEAAGIWQRGNVLIGVFGLLHGAPKTKIHPMDLGLMISDDGLHFREPTPDFAFIPMGKKGSFESGGVIQSNGFVNVGDKTYYWYGGWDGDVTQIYIHSEVGLTTVRRDGFGSLSTISIPDAAIRRHPSFFVYPSGPAGFVTCPIGVKGSADLWLNAEGLSADGRLRVELLDESERPIPGYSGEDSVPVEQSGVRVHVLWKNQSRVGGFEKPFKIKVSFEGSERDNVKFYALYIKQ